MPNPSIATLVGGLKISPVDAQLIRTAMANGKGLVVANRVLSGHGIESLTLPDRQGKDTRGPAVLLYYVNMGDTYDPTLYKINGNYHVGSWGDYVEAYERRWGR